MSSKKGRRLCNWDKGDPGTLLKCMIASALAEKCSSRDYKGAATIVAEQCPWIYSWFEDTQGVRPTFNALVQRAHKGSMGGKYAGENPARKWPAYYAHAEKYIKSGRSLSRMDAEKLSEELRNNSAEIKLNLMDIYVAKIYDPEKNIEYGKVGVSKDHTRRKLKYPGYIVTMIDHMRLTEANARSIENEIKKNNKEFIRWPETDEEAFTTSPKLLAQQVRAIAASRGIPEIRE